MSDCKDAGMRRRVASLKTVHGRAFVEPDGICAEGLLDEPDGVSILEVVRHASALAVRRAKVEALKIDADPDVVAMLDRLIGEYGEIPL